jgi:hypothetical protein
MYHTGVHPFTGERVYSARSLEERRLQRALVQPRGADSAPLVRRALALLGKQAPGRRPAGKKRKKP